MSVDINYFYSSHSILSIKEKIFSSLVSQKKIITIAALALSCLATTYLFSYFYFNKKPSIANQVVVIDEVVDIIREVKKAVTVSQKLLIKDVERIEEEEPNKITIVNENGIVLEGFIQNRVLQGEGKKIYSDGLIVEGTFRDGLLYGLGSMIYSDGSCYIGIFKNDQLHGQGKFRNVVGTIWEGEFQDHQLNGQGKKIESNGRVFKGQFKDGMLNGQGKITEVARKNDFSRIIYEGEFQNDQLLSGQVTKNGKLWKKGHFKEGLLNGEGTIVFPGGVADGQFKNDKLNGKGSYTSFDKEKVWEGEFQDGQLHGKGIYKDGNRGILYEGEFQKAKLHGSGKMTNADGVIFEGQFKEGLLDGQGKIIQPDGKVWKDGIFRSGLLNGPGKIFEPDGTVIEGEFLDDQFIQKGIIRIRVREYL